MKKYLVLLIIFISCCSDYYGKPVPIGDEFEDHWREVDFNGLIYCIANSKTNGNEFFIMDENTVYILNDTIINLFSLPYPELTTIALSYSEPVRLLIGTSSSKIYYCSIYGILKELEIPSLSHSEFLSFFPSDTETFFIVDGNALLKISLFNLHLDTLFYSEKRIVDFMISRDGKIFLATEERVCSSIDQGLSWDTLYRTSGDYINRFARDERERIYIGIGNRILKSDDGIHWTDFYTNTLGNFTFAGIDDGVILLRVAENVASAFKINGDGRCYDISLGIVHKFPVLSDCYLMIATNDKRYLISFRDADEMKSALLEFVDTILPP
jgi:hypothetical protein